MHVEVDERVKYSFPLTPFAVSSHLPRKIFWLNFPLQSSSLQHIFSSLSTITLEVKKKTDKSPQTNVRFNNPRYRSRRVHRRYRRSWPSSARGHQRQSEFDRLLNVFDIIHSNTIIFHFNLFLVSTLDIPGEFVSTRRSFCLECFLSRF